MHAGITMKTIATVCLATLAGVAPIAAQRTAPEEIIQGEGQLVFTDGASYYAFRKDGTFESGPVFRDSDGMLLPGISGQTIAGRWRHDGHGSWVIEGRWGWINGASLLNDFRRMVMRFSGVERTAEVMRMIPGSDSALSVYKTYFTIQELVRVAPPRGRGAETREERLPIIQDLAATATGKLARAQWRIESNRMLEGCVVRLSFAPVPVGTPEPARPETQVWLLRADGTVIPAARPPDEMGSTFADGKVVSTTRVRIYQYPLSARSEAISVVIRVGDDFFTEQVRR